MRHPLSAATLLAIVMSSATTAVAQSPVSTINTAFERAATARNSKKINERYDPVFRKYTKRYFGPAFDWKYFKAQGFAESGLDSSAKSWVGARGVMQLMPSTYREIASKRPDFGTIDQPEWNIAAGILHDRDLLFDPRDLDRGERAIGLNAIELEGQLDLGSFVLRVNGSENTVACTRLDMVPVLKSRPLFHLRKTLMSIDETMKKARERAKQMGLPYEGALTPQEAYEVMREAI